MKRLFTILMILSFLLLVHVPAAFAESNVVVERYEFPVTLSDNQTYFVAGYLYSQIGNLDNVVNCGQRSQTLQVLLHGATYSHSYWDAPVVNGVDYTYAHYMAGQCYSVLALDRLGAGESSLPDGDFLDLPNDADSIAQILVSLRTKQNPTHRKFKRIVLVGHSFGSLDAIYTLGEYGNVADALAVTAWLNSPGTVPIDPEFFAQLLQNEYISVPAEARTALFYYLPSADQAMVDYDNANLSTTITRGFLLDGIDVFTARALGDVAQIKALTKADQVSVPVFVQVSDFDVLFPSASGGDEANFYSNAPSVSIDLLTGIGHGFNLHLNHLEGWQHIDAWIDGVFGFSFLN